jgi:ABC-type Na+ transport system ATPase subunit NatA
MESVDERLELDRNRKTSELSKGYKQKVDIIKVLMAYQEPCTRIAAILLLVIGICVSKKKDTPA